MTPAFLSFLGLIDRPFDSEPVKIKGTPDSIDSTDSRTNNGMNKGVQKNNPCVPEEIRALGVAL
jgi:hypothetical protein